MMEGEEEGGSEGVVVDMVGVEEGGFGSGMGWRGWSGDKVGGALIRLLARSAGRGAFASLLGQDNKGARKAL